MNTATYSSSTANNLWNLIQGLSLTTTDQRWLGDKLIEASEKRADAKQELVFPHIDADFKPSKKVLSRILGPIPEGFDIDKELELMWEERAK